MEEMLLEISNLKFDNKPMIEAMNILAEESKCCIACKKENQYCVILPCCGKVCISCIRKQLIGTDPRIFINALECDKKQISMCVCPIHKIHLPIPVLKQIFNQKEIEQMSISAIKREKKEKVKLIEKIKYPTICIDCKKAMNDDMNSVAVCFKHKICRSCYM